jgi:hypothetical protein
MQVINHFYYNLDILMLIVFFKGVENIIYHFFDYLASTELVIKYLGVMCHMH